MRCGTATMVMLLGGVEDMETEVPESAHRGSVFDSWESTISHPGARLLFPS